LTRVCGVKASRQKRSDCDFVQARRGHCLETGRNGRDNGWLLNTDECEQRAWICLRARKGLLLAAGSGSDDASDTSRRDHWLAGYQTAAESLDFLVRRADPGRPTAPQRRPLEGNQAHDHFVASAIFQSGTLLDYHPSENSDVATVLHCPLSVPRYSQQVLVLRLWASHRASPS